MPALNRITSTHGNLVYVPCERKNSGMVACRRNERGKVSVHCDLRFFGPAPIGELVGAEALLDTELEQSRKAVPAARKRPYLYFGGEHRGHVWIGATGNIEGEMRSSWFGSPLGQGLGKLRFGEFYRFEGDRICDIRCLLDIPGLAAQAGIELFPHFDGKAHITEGPPAEIGIVHTPQDAELTNRTLNLVHDVIVTGCNQLEGSDMKSQGLDRYWHPDMTWHGPWGIGSAFGLDEFHAYAQGPSVRSFPGRRGSWPKEAFIAEGPVAGFAGWPSFIGNFTGTPFRGIAPTGGPIPMNVMDSYTASGNRLSENWVLIDLIRFASDCGVDLMENMPEDPRPVAA